MTRSSPNFQASEPHIYVIIDADPYVLPLIKSALSQHFPKNLLAAITSTTHVPSSSSRLLQIASYESLDFAHLLNHPTSSLANSYVIRKALIRKHYLHNTITSWWSKHPNDKHLKGHVPLTVAFEVDYAEFLDEALAECWELYESFAKEEREWWVLKPGMSDQGQGVRLFSSQDELRAIFEEWEDDGSDSEQADWCETSPAINGQDVIGAGTMTSQLRHFIAQKYVNPPLVFWEHANRKWHIRSYVLAVGALRVYAYREMLALFAPEPYTLPGSRSSAPSPAVDRRVHFTNTCLQDGSREDSVLRFWDLPSTSTAAPSDWKDSVFDQISTATGTLFEAAAREQMIHFQTFENAFEVFGLDWMIHENGTAWLLEVNAFPDFKQSGEELKGVVQGLWDAVAGIAVKGFFDPKREGEELQEEEKYSMRKALDIDLGRR